MRNSTYRWLAWFGLVLLIAANARAADTTLDQISSTTTNLMVSLWEILGLMAVLAVWYAFGRVWAGKVRVAVASRRERLVREVAGGDPDSFDWGVTTYDA